MKLILQSICPRAAIPALILTSIIACNPNEKPEVQAADNPGQHPVPHMYVADTTSTKLEGNFFPMAQLLSTTYNIQETDSIWYGKGGIGAMVDSADSITNAVFMDVFPAQYDDAATDSYVPPGMSGKLTFLYAPTDKNGNQLKYFQLREGATAFSMTAGTVPSGIATIWINLYKTKAMQVLNRWLDTSDSYNYLNYDMSSVNSLSNTVHICYFLGDMEELKTEIGYQASLGDTISGIKAFFAALPKQPKGNQGAYSNRLLSEFEFTQDIGNLHKEFYMDTTPNFKNRPRQTPRFATKKNPFIKFHTFGLDNGQLCPPTCNP
jgi:hypothetical protein